MVEVWQGGERVEVGVGRLLPGDVSKVGSETAAKTREVLTHFWGYRVVDSVGDTLTPACVSRQVGFQLNVEHSYRVGGIPCGGTKLWGGDGVPENHIASYPGSYVVRRDGHEIASIEVYPNHVMWIRRGQKRIRLLPGVANGMQVGMSGRPSNGYGVTLYANGAMTLSLGPGVSGHGQYDQFHVPLRQRQ